MFKKTLLVVVAQVLLVWGFQTQNVFGTPTCEQICTHIWQQDTELHEKYKQQSFMTSCEGTCSSNWKSINHKTPWEICKPICTESKEGHNGKSHYTTCTSACQLAFSKH